MMLVMIEEFLFSESLHEPKIVFIIPQCHKHVHRLVTRLNKISSTPPSIIRKKVEYLEHVYWNEFEPVFADDGATVLPVALDFIVYTLLIFQDQSTDGVDDLMVTMKGTCIWEHMVLY